MAEEEAHLHVKGSVPVNLKYIIIATNQEEEAKLLYGMLFSMKSFVAKLSPNDMKQGFLSYVTSAYRCRGKAIEIPWASTFHMRAVTLKVGVQDCSEPQMGNKKLTTQVKKNVLLVEH